MRTRLSRLLWCISSLMCALSGCTEYSAYRKCGWNECPGDAQVTAEVTGLLNEHRELQPPNQIYVKTLDRVVYLSGQVATDLQRETAAALARGAPGARRVVDDIALTYTGR